MENASLELYNNLGNQEYLKEINGLLSKNFENEKINFVEDNLDDLSFPAWEEFPIKNYWSLGYAHGPLSSEKYLPLLTSRGCPYPCNFCVVPKTNMRKWRSRSPINIIEGNKILEKNLILKSFILKI